MAGFFICQTAKIDDVRESLASAHHWFCEEKRVPTVAYIEEPGISVVKYGRRCAHSADVAQTSDGWLASIGFWSHPRLRSNDNVALLKVLREQGPSVLEQLD